MSLKCTNQKFNLNLPGVNELICENYIMDGKYFGVLSCDTTKKLKHWNLYP